MKNITIKYLGYAFRLILGGIFIFSGILKMGNLTGFEEAIKTYNFFSEWSLGIIKIIIPWSEVTLGMLLILGLFKKTTSFLLSALIFGFLAILSYKFYTSDLVECGCLTLDGKVERVTWRILARDGIFLAMSVFIFWRAILEKRKTKKYCQKSLTRL